MMLFYLEMKLIAEVTPCSAIFIPAASSLVLKVLRFFPSSRSSAAMAGGREWGGEDIEDKSNANEDHEDGEDAPPSCRGAWAAPGRGGIETPTIREASVSAATLSANGANGNPQWI